MRTVAIVLGDNDFGGTFYPLLLSIYSGMELNNFKMSRQEIVTSILSGIEFHYLAFQHGTNHGQRGYGTTEGTVKYLMENIGILFDEEAEEDIETRFVNAEAWYLEIQTGKVYFY